VGDQAQVEKLRTAQTQAGATAVIAFTHSYGPAEDFIHRFQLAAAVVGSADGSGRIWINRYGYLSDHKLALIEQFMQKAGAA
jgi:hypothetical protein